MREVDMRLFDFVLRMSIRGSGAERNPAETPEPDTSWLEWPTLAQYEAHVKGERRFTDEELRKVQDHPRRRRMLEQFESALRPAFLGRFRAAIKELIDLSAQWPCIWPMGSMIGSTEADVLTATVVEGKKEPAIYPAIVERPDGSLDSKGYVFTTLAPKSTPDGYLVGQISLSESIKNECSSKGYQAELRVLAVSPEVTELHSVITSLDWYFKAPLPSSFLDLEQWKNLSPGGGLPFVFVLRLTESHLEAHAAGVETVREAGGATQFARLIARCWRELERLWARRHCPVSF